VELRANQRWLRNRRRELLATIPHDAFMHSVELSVIEGVLDDMKTPAGAAAFKEWLRETKARHKRFWETTYLRA
jgi:hypothetical protein